MEELTRLKNTATIITYPLLNISGIPVSGATALDSEWDGWSDTVIPNGFTDCTNEATEIGSTGIYYLSLTQPEMNNDYVYVQTKSVPCLTQHILIRTIPGDSYASVQYISGIVGNLSTAAEFVTEIDASSVDLNTIINNISLLSGVVDNIHTDANTIVGKLPTNYIMGSTVLTAKDDDIDNIYNIVNNASYGNSALSGIVSTINSKVTPLSFTGSDIKATLDGEGVTVTTNSDKAGYSLDAVYDSAKTASSQSSVNSISGIVVNNHTDIATIVTKLPTNYIMGSFVQTDKDDDIDNIYNIVNNASYGNSALSGLVANNNLNLYAIKAKLPTNYIMGSPDAADKLTIIPTQIIPQTIDLANTATFALGIQFTTNRGSLPTTAEITPGTITIKRKAKGGTSWTTIRNAMALEEVAGGVFFTETFSAASGYAEGDSISVLFSNVSIIINSVTYVMTGSSDYYGYTYIRETGVKEMYAKLPTNYIMGSSDVDNHDTDIDSILTYSQSISGIVSSIHLDTDSVETGISNISGIVSTINTNTKKLLYGDAVWYSDNGSAGTDIGVNGTMYNQSNSPADMRILATALNLKKYRLTIDSAATGLAFDDDYTGWEFAGVHNISWIDINGKIPSGCHFENLQVFGVMGTPSTPGIYAGGDFYNCLLYTLENVNSITVFNCTFAESIDFVDNHSSGFAMMMTWDCRNDIGESNNPWIDWNVDASVFNFYAYVLGYRGDIHLNGMTDGEIIFDGDGELTIDVSCVAGTVVVSGNVKVTNNSAGVTVTYKQIMRDDDGYVYLTDAQMDVVNNIASWTEFTKDVEGGRWKIEANQMIIYKSDNKTEVARFNLKDSSGNPAMTNVFQRERV